MESFEAYFITIVSNNQIDSIAVEVSGSDLIYEVLSLWDNNNE